MENINGSVAFVTGASSGIGEGIAKMLASEGAKVVLLARRQDELQRVSSEIRQLGGITMVLPVDIRDDEALVAAVKQTENLLGPIDILVNNAAIAYMAPIHEVDMLEWDTTFEVNLRAPLLLCRAVLPGMRARKRGFIINIASEAGVYVYSGMGAYAISKHALRILTELIQDENQESGIKAWAICPGFVDTPMAGWASGTNPANFLAVDEVVSVVRFLLAQGANVKMGPEILIRTTGSPYLSDG